MSSLVQYSKNNFAHLWIAFIEGDSQSFAVFYNLSYKMLYAYGINLGASEDQVRDIIQDIFIKLYTNPKLITDSSTIRPFLLCAMRNAFLNLLKKQKKMIDYKLLEHFELNYSININELDEKEERLHTELKVKQILTQLTPRQKEIIYLRFLYQMEYDDISRIMNLSPQAARNLIHRALDKVRKSDTNKTLFLI